MRWNRDKSFVPSWK